MFEESTNEELAVLWQDKKDQRARAEVVRRYEKLVAKMSGKRMFKKVERDELIQAGRIGVLCALDEWDRTRGTSVSTVAMFYIRNEMGHVCSRRNSFGGMSRNIIIGYNARIRRGMDHDQAIATLAKDRGRSVKNMEEVIAANTLHASMSDEDFTEPAEDPTAWIIDTIERKELMARVQPLLDALPERTRTCILRHVGNDEQFSSIAKDLGCTRERARQIFHEGLSRIRSGLEAA